MQTTEEINRAAAVIAFKRQFGPFIKCPECLGLVSGCKLCGGKGKVIQEDIDSWENPVSKMMRDVKSDKFERAFSRAMENNKDTLAALAKK